MDELKIALKKVLADTFVMYFKAHAFHWNVEGSDFKQYHDYFGELYSELFEAIDTIAEHCRAIDCYAPTTMAQLIGLSAIQEQDEPITDPKTMVYELAANNHMLIVTLMRAYQEAEASSELGVANFLQDRIDVHNKHGWMLRAISK